MAVQYHWGTVGRLPCFTHFLLFVFLFAARAKGRGGHGIRMLWMGSRSVGKTKVLSKIVSRPSLRLTGPKT